MGQSYTSSVAHLEYRNNQKSKTQVINELCIQLNIEGNNLHSEYKRESDYGFTHEKFSQTYNDIPIYGSSYIIHTQSNNAISSNGYLAANVNINTEPKLQQATAERIAKSEMPSAEYFDDRIEPTANIVNAFWDGNNAWFGDGDCHRGPLTTLEVVAHEFMHGITDYTSDLIYAFESGAINESMSDIFGKALEYYIDPDHFRWTIGESFMQTDFIEPFRYMDDPNRKNMPAYYKGKYWTDGGGVHQHSAIGNLWFHLLVEGRSDTTELGESYNVTGIGMDKAIGIVWEIQSNYLTPTATYNDMYLSSIDATSAIYGEESPELNDVIQAWKAVGLPHNAPGPNALSHDIAVQIDFVAQRQCLRNSYLPFTVKLVNYGSENIPDSSALQLIIEDANNEDTWIEIFDAIPSGQTLSITIDSMFYISDPGRYFITAFADYEL